jgi:hypothetical protein
VARDETRSLPSCLRYILTAVHLYGVGPASRLSDRLDCIMLAVSLLTVVSHIIAMIMGGHGPT